MITLTPPQRTQANHDGKPVTGNYSTMHQILDEHLSLTLTDFTFLPILIRFIRSRRLFFPSLGALPVPSGTGSLSLSIIGLVCSSSDIVKIQRMKRHNDQIVQLPLCYTKLEFLLLFLLSFISSVTF